MFVMFNGSVKLVVGKSEQLEAEMSHGQYVAAFQTM